MTTSIDIRPEKLAKFVEGVVEISKMGLPPEEAIEHIYPEFQQMLDSPDWLSDEFKVPLPEKFAQYLVHREEDNSLSVMAMVVPAGCTTPVHDHLAWGLVGVYQGSQLETVYHREDDGSDPDRARLTHVATNVLRVGDITRLVPPDGDIHKIETMDKDQPSISIHILGNDIGCRWRHAFEVAKEEVLDFRSGYVNAPCEED